MKCPNCDGRGAVQIAPNVKGLKRCPVCGGSGKITEYDGLRKFWCDYKCEVCNGSGEIKEQTKEEWFCSLPTEEKAEVIAEKIRHAQLQYVPTYGTFTNSDWWEKWLKEKHNG